MTHGRHDLVRAIMLVVSSALLLTATIAGAKEDLPEGLVKAYKKEYAFLEAEKKALQKRLAGFDAESRQELKKAESEVNALQGSVLRVRGNADELEASLAEAERIVAITDEDTDIIEETLARAVETLQNEGFTVALPEKEQAEKPADPQKTGAGEGDGETDEKAATRDEGTAEGDQPSSLEMTSLLPQDDEARNAFVESLFSMASEAMRNGGEIRREKGSFFGADGTRVDGVLIHLGRIATYGVSTNVSGALAPAGSGRLKIWPVDTAPTAMALEEGKTPATLQVFLYESLDKGVEHDKGKTLMTVLESGGPIGWVIVVVGILCLVLVIARTVILFGMGAGSSSLAAKLVPLVTEGRIEEAMTACRRSHASAGRVLLATLQNLLGGKEKLEDVISESILAEAPGLERFGSIIMVFAAISPLLGLLGTVTGIISTFDIITEFGTGDPKMLSGGISEALVTTELGLIVAIPTLLIGTMLSGKAQGILGDLEKSALSVVNAAHPDVRPPVPLAGGEGPGETDGKNGPGGRTDLFAPAPGAR